MAEVFKAVKTGPDGFEKIVALKKIIPFHSDRSHFIRMLSTEAKIHSYLSHPNIVQILDFFEEDGQYSMVLEYVDGKNLKELLQSFRDRGQILPWQACIYIALEILKALNYAHNKSGPDGPLQIIHRDVSPHNILISYQGEVKLSDFGIAKAKVDRDETASGVLKGKYRYLSPEQILDEKLTPSSDLFSLAVTLYETLSNQYPFGEQQEYQTIQKILDQPHAPLQALLPEIKIEIASALDQAMQKRGADRYPSAKDFYEDLLAAQDQNWISHGSELLAELMAKIPANERRDSPIDQTSVLARPIHNQHSLLDDSPTYIPLQKDTKINLLLNVVPLILAAIVGFGVLSATYVIKRKKSNAVVEQPVSQNSVTTTAPATKTAEPTPTPPKIMKSFGKLQISGPLGTKIYVNGKNMGELPAKALELPAGSYMILLDRESQGQQIKKVNVNAKETVTISWK